MLLLPVQCLIHNDKFVCPIKETPNHASWCNTFTVFHIITRLLMFHFFILSFVLCLHSPIHQKEAHSPYFLGHGGKPFNFFSMHLLHYCGWGLFSNYVFALMYFFCSLHSFWIVCDLCIISFCPSLCLWCCKQNFSLYLYPFELVHMAINLNTYPIEFTPNLHFQHCSSG